MTVCDLENDSQSVGGGGSHGTEGSHHLPKSKTGVEGRGGACNDASNGVRETGDAGPKGEGERDMEETSAPRERERAGTG